VRSIDVSDAAPRIGSSCTTSAIGSVAHVRPSDVNRPAGGGQPIARRRPDTVITLNGADILTPHSTNMNTLTANDFHFGEDSARIGFARLRNPQARLGFAPVRPMERGRYERNPAKIRSSGGWTAANITEMAKARITLGIAFFVAAFAVIGREYPWVAIPLMLIAVFLVVWGRQSRATEQFISALPCGRYILKVLHQFDLIISPRDQEYERHLRTLIAGYPEIVRTSLEKLRTSGWQPRFPKVIGYSFVTTA